MIQSRSWMEINCAGKCHLGKTRLHVKARARGPCSSVYNEIISSFPIFHILLYLTAAK